ncbi:MAG: HAMP domain-containing histidine kinase [Firmicutes bacterium]|nr:HAMP domain-containing histidine kinase [Bacillota bacterium]
MIKKLRVKLVTAAMASLLVVFAVILGVVAVFNYREIAFDADVTLSVLAENDGKFPDSMLSMDDHRFSPETPYQTRYFSLTLTSEGGVISVNTGKIAAVDTATAIDYAEAVLSGGRSQGFFGNYRYIVYSDNQEIHLFFLDCGSDLSAFRSFVLTSFGVSAVGLLAVGLLLGFVSGRIVKPFSESYEKQKQFITDAGHELKTPLTIIDADAEVLEMDFGENEWLSDIQGQTKRLAELTNSLILLSRMEETQAQTEMIEFPLSDVAEETVDTFHALARTRNKVLSAEIQPMISLRGDEKAIRRLITILLDNAVKYSDDGGDIRLTLEKQKSTIRLSVYNTAQSVTKESLAHLFDRFYRADQSRNSQTGGYGLGLSIAQAIVNAHKGKITATTQDEKSLRITVTFPT